MSKYVQSFYQYPVTFSSIGKSFPAREADGEMRNLIEVTDAELEKLQNSEPFFRALVRDKKYRILNHMPESYKPAATQINEAHAAAEAAKQEADELRARLAKYEGKAEEPEATEVKEIPLEEMAYKDLQTMAQDLGIENKNVKKSDLIKAIEEAKK